tara:strand:- start:608 stop:775 length:168 start_codon:yes stop_codon:yes gene_type:complete
MRLFFYPQNNYVELWKLTNLDPLDLIRKRQWKARLYTKRFDYFEENMRKPPYMIA